jgi:hypothetical protein
MLLVATLLVALLAGGGIALYLQLQSTKGAGMVKAARTTLYCAEAGLAASRKLLALNYLSWPLLLDGDDGNDPSWYPIRGDIDGEAGDDFEVKVRDNDDEVPPALNNLALDNDRQIFVVGRCIKNAEVSREVVELLLVASSGQVYTGQAGGGALNSGNQQPPPP